MTRLAKPEKKAGKGTTNGAECTPNILARQLGGRLSSGLRISLYTHDLQQLGQLAERADRVRRRSNFGGPFHALAVDPDRLHAGPAGANYIELRIVADVHDFRRPQIGPLDHLVKDCR